MKPVRMQSGYSDDITPMSRGQLQPRGLAVTTQILTSQATRKDAAGAAEPQFTVLASHYQNGNVMAEPVVDYQNDDSKKNTIT